MIVAFIIALIFLVVLAGSIVYIERVFQPRLGEQRKDDDQKNGAEEEKELPHSQRLNVETVEVAGREEEEKETILFIHGSFGSMSLWKHVVETAWPQEQRENLQLVFPDLLGHGDSPRSPSMTYSVKQNVDSLVDALRRYVPSCRALHIVGLSLGATLAIALSARLIRTQAPWSLRSLTLVSTAYFPSTDRETVLREMRDFNPVFHLPNSFYLFGRYLLPKMRSVVRRVVGVNRYYKKGPQSKHRVAMMKNACSTDMHALASSVESLIVRYDVNAGFETIRQVELPILIIDGERDKIYSNDVGRENLLRAAGPNARRIVVPDGAHAFCIERPDELVKPLQEFLEQIKQ